MLASAGHGQHSALPLSSFHCLRRTLCPSCSPKKCNCKKSKCLKLYCDCFANGGYCGPACSCANCANKVENRELVRAQRDQIKQRNPNAFVQKVSHCYVYVYGSVRSAQL